MNRKIKKTLAAVVALGMWGVTVQADPPADVTKAQKILSDLHHANQMEIVMGQMAKDKGASEQVRSYGDRLVKDHQDADQKVQQLAKKDGITLVAPSTTGVFDRIAASREKDTMSELSKKTGTDFDKAFTDAMVSDHKRDINSLESDRNSIKQSDIRDLIASLLPTLQQHLDQAQQIQQRNG